MGIDKELLDILVCPKCKGDLEMGDDEKSLNCKTCSLKYPIRDDIPVMLIDEALPLDQGKPSYYLKPTAAIFSGSNTAP